LNEKNYDMGLEYESPSNLLKFSTKIISSSNNNHMTASATPKNTKNKENIENEGIQDISETNFLKTPRDKSRPTMDTYFGNSGNKLNVSPFFNKK